ncbi:MAG TPA: FG-GAP-like repeat-containing protein, partial [Pyrinomonadaceae bacterium]|nr:FG-GAP-like repeat-containing protein [Pyrinomonadaceae bacterium]
MPHLATYLLFQVNLSVAFGRSLKYLLGSLLALACVAGVVRGQSFAPSAIYTVSPGPLEVVLGDFDEDGKLDVATSNNVNASVSILRGNGDGTFQTPVNYPTGAQPKAIAVGDFNKDGNLDLIIADLTPVNSNQSFSVLLGNGDGTFRTRVSSEEGSRVTETAVGDFNGDGFSDLMAVYSDSSIVAVRIGRGDGTFHAPSNYSVGRPPRDLVVRDFNRDGKADVAVPLENSDPNATAVAVLLGNGNGTLQSPVRYSAATDFIAQITAGDYNGDGIVDLAATSSFSGGRISILLGNGDGTFQPRKDASSSGSNRLLSADLDFDGRLDVVTLQGSGTGLLGILGGNGDGTMRPVRNYSINPGATEAVAGDLNGDGKPDLIIADRNNFISVLINQSGSLAVRGVVTNEQGGAMAGVRMTLSGGASSYVITAADGSYSFLGLAAGSSYTLTPSRQNYRFSPEQQIFNELSADQTVNFTGTLRTYTIGGAIRDANGVGVGGVTVTLGGAVSAVTTTASDGRYSFPSLAGGGNYTVTPSRLHYGFDPPSRSFTNLGTDRTADFTATHFTYALSGRVTRGGTGLGGVTINLTGDMTATTVTDSTGAYSFANVGGGFIVTVTPALPNYIFSPAREIIKVGGPLPPINFTAELASSSVQFTQTFYLSDEGDGRATLTITRTGDTSGVATLDYRTTDGDTFTVGCADSVRNQGGAYARCDFATSVGTVRFGAGESSKTILVPIIDDGHDEGDETFQLQLSNASGAAFGSTHIATVIIRDNDGAASPNPVVASPQFFVRQQYLDFLSREPDTGGFNAWLGVLNNCQNIFTPPNVPSGCDRIYVSGEGFFRSVEFQLKGFYVFRFYKVGFNRLPEYLEVVSDMSFVAGQTAQEVFARKAQLATLITERVEFKAAYDGMSNSQYVSTLLGRYSLTQVTTPDPSQPDGAAKVTLTSADLTGRLDANTLTRAQVLRAVADSDEVERQEVNNAFVGMQYYGYLRRKPDDAGFQAWLRVLQSGDVRTMVNGFLNS